MCKNVEDPLALILTALTAHQLIQPQRAKFGRKAEAHTPTMRRRVIVGADLSRRCDTMALGTQDIGTVAHVTVRGRAAPAHRFHGSASRRTTARHFSRHVQNRFLQRTQWNVNAVNFHHVGRHGRADSGKYNLVRLVMLILMIKARRRGDYVPAN